MQRPRGKLLPVSTVQSKPKNTAEIIYEILMVRGRTRRSDLYPLLKINEVTVRKVIRQMLRKGIIKEDICECGHTGYLKV